MNAPPCMPDCPGRKSGCHDHCEKYLAWKEERQKVKAWLSHENRTVENEQVKRAGWKNMRWGSRNKKKK